MHTLNRTLEDKVLDADGQYLNSQGLQPLEQYFQTYALRLETYQMLRDRSPALVVQALQKMAQANPDIIKKHGQRCQYDMSEVLRYIALAILRDDEVFFKEQMMAWLDTILLAHKRHTPCSTAYRYLQNAINVSFPPANSMLLRPYLDSVILVLQSHA
ncbi:phycobilisome protein [Oculatella sp. LEGE 06141]|uniref:phycobilisome protein n=1 Tax=Oculatella sp. LEGE 06141 TaxID=1828648 RepID=UPI00187FD03D|nr:phycobilisome protein [Oculatella sp. LEGE 06141]MBE9179038.1 phycobilisome protein [Oculatella sp. LEGE 06141]